jgi:hypothetical protein
MPVRSRAPHSGLPPTSTAMDEVSSAAASIPSSSSTALVARVYEEVRREVNTWQRQSSQSGLDALDRRLRSSPEDEDFARLAAEMLSAEGLESNNLYFERSSVISSGVSFVVADHPNVGGRTISQLNLHVNTFTDDLPHCPQYESCAPIMRSIYVGDDADSLDFVHLADDSTFDPEDFLSQHTSLAWLAEQPDPVGMSLRKKLAWSTLIFLR